MKKVAKWTKNAGIEVIGSFVIGLPGETPELARQTIQNAIELDPDYVQFAIACPYPGTQLAKEIKQGKWGKFVSDELEEYTYKLARDIASLAPLSHAVNKLTMHQVQNKPSLESLTEEEADLPLTQFDTKDYLEGYKAFLDKRRPNFIGE